MKWVIVGVLVCLVRFGEGGAIRCSPGVQDPSCIAGLELEAPVESAREGSERETAAVEAECLAGSEWDSNCHRCTCSDAGVAVCLRQAACSQEAFSDPIKCKANTTFARDCNTCTCLDSGLGLCTLDKCARSAIPKKSDLPSGRECAPGTHWKSQCNQCGCSSAGNSFCTEKACIGQVSESLMRCAPDSMWRNECNTCWCTSDGLPMCTKMGCVSSVLADVEGNPGDASLGEANSSISRKTRAVAQEKEAPKTCQPGQEFRMDCNKCLCDNEGQDFSCTRNDCNNNNNGGVRSRRDTSADVPRKCNPGRVFAQDCNVCRCTTDGLHATCTLKRCSGEQDNSLSEIESEPDSSFRCNPGEKFKRDCNNCTCSADGRTEFCTTLKCDQDIISPSDAN